MPFNPGSIIESLTTDQRHLLFAELRQYEVIHPLETALNIRAEAILEAIHRSGPLTLRMMRGVIAESAFKTYVIDNLNVENVEIFGDQSYDYHIRKNGVDYRIQVKLQRSEGGLPLILNVDGFEPCFAVEPQRTRNDKKGGKNRPYSRGDFDIIAVSMQPSTGDWSKFRYARMASLLDHQEGNNWLKVMQPVHAPGIQGWTDSLEDLLD